MRELIAQAQAAGVDPDKIQAFAGRGDGEALGHAIAAAVHQAREAREREAAKLAKEEATMSASEAEVALRQQDVVLAQCVEDLRAGTAALRSVLP